MGLAGDAVVGNAPERSAGGLRLGDCELRSHRFTWRMSALWPTRWMNCCSSTGKTWTFVDLGEHIPDSSLHLPGFHLIRADRTELSGKMRGGRICFYVNEGWCMDVTVLKKSCSPHLETLFINCKPFYSLREFSSFILVGVYIHPQACVTEALQQLADQIRNVEQQHPDSVLIVLGDFNRANLSHELTKLQTAHQVSHQGHKHPGPLLHNFKGTPIATVPRAALGLSDHCLVHLIRQKLKSAKLVVKTVKR
ncbi:hypothetical protein L3Q82_006694 [Scortum barcoo]|uniref:Uncharacterized protein n=1 Tax=Scortum barcoo TaxID=214431 RepID=A0ACB8WW50_9TELE|nr:hypothetical protein L3Q82_006694 [Scortum barcoo]